MAAEAPASALGMALFPVPAMTGASVEELRSQAGAWERGGILPDGSRLAGLGTEDVGFIDAA